MIASTDNNVDLDYFVKHQLRFSQCISQDWLYGLSDYFVDVYKMIILFQARPYLRKYETLLFIKSFFLLHYTTYRYFYFTFQVKS